MSAQRAVYATEEEIRYPVKVDRAESSIGLALVPPVPVKVARHQDETFIIQRENQQLPLPLVPNRPQLDAKIKTLIDECSQEHPVISTNRRIVGGIPCIDGTRLSVGQILGRLKALGSIQAVVDYYAPDISEEQVEEAIAYAQAFIEKACDPYQAYD